MYEIFLHFGHSPIGHLLPGLFHGESSADPVLVLRMHDCKTEQRTL